MKLVSVAEMQQIERQADAGGLTYELMMENAGRGLAQAVDETYHELRQSGALGLVGSGNNGGDTLVALDHLARLGWAISAYLVRPRPSEDPLLERVKTAGGLIHIFEDDPDYILLDELVRNHAVLLDGVLGTGIRLPLKPEVAGILGHVKDLLARVDQPPQVIAVDCPSGVDLDSGEAAPQTIPADLTVTMAAVKTGLLSFPAFNYVGKLRLVGIGLPAGEMALPAWKSLRRQVATATLVRGLLPERPLDAHKGTFGTALIVAGSLSYSGAVLLAGEGAYRVGAGLVTLAVPGPLHAALAGRLPETTWLLLPHERGVISSEAVPLIRQNIARATALLVGPGFGLESTTQKFLEGLLEGGSQKARRSIGFLPEGESQPSSGQPGLPPCVIDADALKLLARLEAWPTRLPSGTILTPHPGEMATLTGLAKDEIQAWRLETAERFSGEWGHVLVLKGAFTVVAAPDGQTTVIPVATPALARAGTGDVLAGLIAGLLAQGLPPYQAAVAGAWIHAQAGLTAAEWAGGTAAVLAGDVLQAVPAVLSDLQSGDVLEA